MKMTRKQALVAAFAAVPALGFSLDWIMGDDAEGGNVHAALFDGSKSSSRYRERWTGEAVAVAIATLKRRDRFVAANFTKSEGTVAWTVDVDDSDLPVSRETKEARDDWLEERALGLRDDLDQLINQKSGSGSDPLGALASASKFGRLSEITIWSDMITITKEFHLDELVDEVEFERAVSSYARRLGRLQGIKVTIAHAGRGTSENPIARQNEKLVNTVLNKVHAKVEWAPSLPTA